MSKTINKKYFLLQNLFYQSIPNQSFVYKKNSSLEKTEKNLQILDNLSESNKIRNESSFFVSANQKDINLSKPSLKGKLYPLQKIGKKQPILNDRFLPVSKNLIQTYNYIHRNKINRQVPFIDGNKLILQKKSLKISPLFRNENFIDFEKTTKSKNVSKVKSSHQIGVNLSFHKFLKSPSNSFQRSGIHGFNFPYKKSFFCYWLLPFLGFVSCFPILKNDQFSFSIDNKTKKKETQILTNISYVEKPSSSNFSISMDHQQILNWDKKLNVSKTSAFREIQNLSYLYSLDLEKNLQTNQSFEMSLVFNEPVSAKQKKDSVKDIKENFTNINKNKVETCMNFALSKTWKKKNSLPFWKILNPFSPLFDSISDPYYSRILLNSSFKSYLMESKVNNIQPISFLREGKIHSQFSTGLIPQTGEKKESTNKILFSPEFAKKLEKDSFVNILARSNSSIYLKEMESKNNLALQNLRDSLFSKSTQPVSFFLDFDEISESKEKNLEFAKLKDNEFSKSPVLGFKKASKLLKNFFGTCNDWSTNNLMVPKGTRKVLDKTETKISSVKAKNENLSSIDFDKNFKIDDNLYKVSPLVLMKRFSKISKSSKSLNNNLTLNLSVPSLDVPLKRQKSLNLEMTSKLGKAKFGCFCFAETKFLENEILDLLDVFPKNQSVKLKKLKNLLKSVKKTESKNLNDSEIKNEIKKQDSPLLSKFKKESLYSLIFSDFSFKKESSNLVSLNFDKEDCSAKTNLNKSETLLEKDPSKFKKFLDQNFITNYLEDSKEPSMYQPIFKIDPIWIANSKQQTKVSFDSKKDINFANVTLKSPVNLSTSLSKRPPKPSNLNNFFVSALQKHSLIVYNHSKESLEIKIQNPKRLYFNGSKTKKENSFLFVSTKENHPNLAKLSLDTQNKTNFKKSSLNGPLNSSKYLNFLSKKIISFWFTRDLQKWPAVNLVKTKLKIKKMKTKKSKVKLTKEVRNPRLKNNELQPSFVKNQFHLKEGTTESLFVSAKQKHINLAKPSLKATVCLNVKPWTKEKKSFPAFSKLEKICNSYFSVKSSVFNESLNQKNFSLRNFVYLRNRITNNNLMKQKIQIPSSSLGFGSFKSGSSTVILNQNSKNSFLKNDGIFKKEFFESKLSKTKSSAYFSPNLFVKNRLIVIKKKSPLFYPMRYWKQKLKEKYKQRKNRKKKLRGEILKKRQRYYPRPTWIRSQMYKQFIKSRYPLKFIKMKNSNSLNSIDKPYLAFQTFTNIEKQNNLSSNAIFLKSETPKNFSELNSKLRSVRSKIYRNYQENPFWLNDSIKISRMKNSPIKSQNLENDLNLYEVSRKTLGKLKKDCWKSYWLRSNLNPYLKRINLSLRSVKEQIKKPQKNFQVIYSGNLSKREMNRFEFEEKNKNIELFVNLNIKNGLRVKNQFKNLSTGNQWQTLTNLKEYQRILSQRMQQTISNIRENVRVDGDPKARASRIGNRKLLRDSPVSFRIGKTLTFPIPTSTSSIPFYGDMSKIGTLWTLNQSNISQSTLLNNRKYLWQNQKRRSQARSNKTKKILYKMNKLAKSSFTEFNKISFSNFQSIPKSVELEFISTLKQKPFFNKFVITSFETKEKLNSFLKFYSPEVYSKNLILKDQFFDSQSFGANDYNLQSNSFTIDDLFLGETQKNYNQSFKKSFSIGEAKLRKKEQKLTYLGFLNEKKSFLSKFKRQDPFKIGKFAPSISDAWWNPAPFKEVLEFNNPLEKNRTGFDSFGTLTLNEAKFQVEQNLNGWVQEKNDLKEIGRWVSPFLFHFCAVLFFLNIPEIRGFMKWSVIWFSTLFKIYLTMAIKISSLVISSNKDKPAKNLNGKNEAIVLPKISRLRKSYFTHIQTYRLLWFKPIPHFLGTSKNLSKTEINSFKKINEKPLFFKVGEMGVSPFKLKKQKLDGPMESQNFVSAFKAKFMIESNSSKPSIGLDSWIRPTQKWLYFSVLNLWTRDFLPKSKNSSPLDNAYIIDPTKSALEQKLLFLKNLPPSVAKRISLKKIKQSRSKSKRLAMVESLGEKRWGVLKNQSRLNKKTRDELKLIFFKWQISTFAKLYFEMSIWFLKGFDALQAMLGSIYFFFEKPGDLLVDMFAYAFLVEWSSDFLATIPESQHMDSIRTMNSSARAVRPFLMSYPFIHLNGSQVSSAFLNFGSWTLWTSSAFLLNRQILEMYEMILQKWFQPDNDLILRQKKGRIFWDLWSQVFIDVADDANINIVELTSLKEEQNRLFEKLEALEDRSQNKTKSFRKKEKVSEKSSFEDEFKLARLPIKPVNLQKFETTSQLRMGTTDPHQHWKYWSIHQSFAYQGKDTDLFIQKSPARSFSQIPSIKYSKSAPTTIGKMVCQIYSGIFYDKVAKNILVVGGNNGQSPFIIQAIAGETEFKMIQDNAQRYTMVQNGVAIGIKLLKDVFEALSSHTPCLFLLEDIHHIGGRRPLLFSDQAAMPPEESGYDKQAPLDEKNQVTYNFSKHIINHYKKPYKGDFSLLIPTNHFSLNLFTGGSSPQIRTTPGSVNNFDAFQSENKASSVSDEMKISPLERWLGLHSNDSKNRHLSSSFQIESNQLLAPPATSPFSVLLLKENQKFKPQQVVKEMPWGGFPSEKLALLSKFNYSIRVKIALLTDKALSNLSIQLDMITDLLVIIDGVKGDRGFIVFATTHIPYNLDPALRRPGRFDETISLPLIPNLLNRWDIFKIQSNHEKPSPYSFFSKGRTVDFTKMYGLFQSNHGVISLLRKTNNLKNQVLLSNVREGTKNHKLLNQSLSSQKYFTLTYNLTNPLRNDRKNAVGLIDPSWFRNVSKINFEKSSQQIKGKTIESFRSKNQSQAKGNPTNKRNYNSKIGDLIGTNLITRPYFYGSQAVISFLPNSAKRNLKSQNLKVKEKINKKFFMPSQDVFLLNSPTYLSMFVSPQTFSAALTQLIAGKLGELFISSTLTYQSMSKMQNEFFISENQKNMNSAKIHLKEIGNPGFVMLGESQNLFGIEKIWKAATSLLFSILTKRYLYNQNLIIPKLLYFSNYSSLQQSPSPPTSTILLPLKRHENYRRTFSTQQIQKKANFEGKTLQEIWEFHQQQRFVKRLYKLPLREYFRSEIIKNKFSGFANSLIVLSSVEKNMNFTTNINHYYRNRVLNRHQNYLKNQWWTGQLYEHNLETTFLSAIDWRSTSVDSIQDVSIDFPDSDQFYNVQNRRWMLTSNSWQNWLSSEKTNYNSIMNQYIFDCMIRAFNSLDESREVLDFYAFSSLNECMLKDLKEITILSLWKRFSESEK